MNRNQVVVLLVTLVCIGGLALAAATVSTPGSPDSGSGQGEGPESGDGKADETQKPPSLSKGSGFPKILFWLARIFGIITFPLTMGIAVYMIAKTLDLRRAIAFLLVAAIVMVVSLVLLSVVMDVGRLPESEMPSPTTSTPGGGGNEADSSGRTPTENPNPSTDIPIALLGVFGVVVLLLVTVIYRYSGSDTDVEITAETDGDETDATGDIQAVGEAAGRAADKLDTDSESVENAIYQAWHEMTDALDVDEPRTTTPEEFADIAIDAGMAPDDVRELTWLFEEVRYGDAPVTEEREERAQAALRRTRDTYAGESHNE